MITTDQLQGTKTVPHVKMVPHCKNVTKQNCVTLWETDANGKQVDIVMRLLQFAYINIGL